MKTLAQEIAFALLAGLAGAAISLHPFIDELEETHGLAWLFQWRGAVAPPKDVVVIAIDQASAQQLGLPPKPQQWPRGLHAKLIRQLSQAGASVIVLDLLFDNVGLSLQDDNELAAAIRAAANVVLVESLVQNDIAVEAANGNHLGGVAIEKSIMPIAVLAEAALGSAPFPLPKNARVSAAWFFKTGAGSRPMLPSLALQVHALPAYGLLVELIQTVDPALAASLPSAAKIANHPVHVEDLTLQLRELFYHHPQLADRLLRELATVASDPIAPDKKAMLRALIGLYTGQEARYLNFYGPARHITTVPYYQALNGHALKPGALHGKAVFIGYSPASPDEQDRIRDDYHTVFSQKNGLQLSGVEIAATAFANLLDGKPLTPLHPLIRLSLLVGWGSLLVLLCQRWRIARAVAMLAVTTGLYLWLAAQLFSLHSLWLPLITPLLLQGPLALLGATLLRYARAKRERDHMQEAFNLFIPRSMVEQLARDSGALTTANQLTHGACMATDGASYTSLAESMDPVALTALMNRYYATLFAPVAARGGVVSDVKGDAMLAIWSGESHDPDSRRKACHAALEIQAALASSFQTESGKLILPTRIGLDFGPMTLSNVGAAQHYEYRAVGDTVNTASRIEGLNKQLGTSILASQAMVEGLEEFLLRDLGAFLMPGKSIPIKVFEIITQRDRQSPRQLSLCIAFAAALADFRLQKWAVAASTFSAILDIEPEDGPSRFYLRQCVRNTTEIFPTVWNPVITIREK